MHEPLSSHGSSMQPSLHGRNWLAVRGPPVSGCPIHPVRMGHPLRSSPLQDLHRYYEVVGPCARHRYSPARGASACGSPFASGRQVPTFRTRTQDRVLAAFMPDAARTVNRCLPDSSRDNDYSPVLTSSIRIRHVISGSMPSTPQTTPDTVSPAFSQLAHQPGS